MINNNNLQINNYYDKIVRNPVIIGEWKKYDRKYINNWNELSFEYCNKILNELKQYLNDFNDNKDKIFHLIFDNQIMFKVEKNIYGGRCLQSKFHTLHYGNKLNIEGNNTDWFRRENKLSLMFKHIQKYFFDNHKLFIYDNTDGYNNNCFISISNFDNNIEKVKLWHDFNTIDTNYNYDENYFNHIKRFFGVEQIKNNQPVEQVEQNNNVEQIKEMEQKHNMNKIYEKKILEAINCVKINDKKIMDEQKDEEVKNENNKNEETNQSIKITNIKQIENMNSFYEILRNLLESNDINKYSRHFFDKQILSDKEFKDLSIIASNNNCIILNFTEENDNKTIIEIFRFITQIDPLTTNRRKHKQDIIDVELYNNNVFFPPPIICNQMVIIINDDDDTIMVTIDSVLYTFKIDCINLNLTSNIKNKQIFINGIRYIYNNIVITSI